MDIIKIYWTPAGWMAVHPILPNELLPTAFTAEAPAELVLAEIAALNCGFTVELVG